MGKREKKESKALAPGQSLAERLSAWLEGAWLLTSTEEPLASKSLSLPILPTALSHTTALWQLVKVSSIWEERNCRCALRAGARTSRSTTAGVLAGHVQSLWPGR